MLSSSTVFVIDETAEAESRMIEKREKVEREIERETLIVHCFFPVGGRKKMQVQEGNCLKQNEMDSGQAQRLVKHTPLLAPYKSSPFHSLFFLCLPTTFCSIKCQSSPNEMREMG